MLKGSSILGSGAEGLYYALLPTFTRAKRAFMYYIAEAMTVAGAAWFSLGRDQCFVDKGYFSILYEKLRWADSILTWDNGKRHLISLCKPLLLAQKRGFLLLELNPKGTYSIAPHGEVDAKMVSLLAKRLLGQAPFSPQVTNQGNEYD